MLELELELVEELDDGERDVDGECRCRVFVVPMRGRGGRQ